MSRTTGTTATTSGTARRSSAGPHAQPKARRSSPRLHSPAIRVLRQFRQIFGAVRRHFRQVESKAGIGGAQLWAVSLICAQPGIGVNELARSMDVHQSTASNLVKALIDAGLVESVRMGDDRRRVALRALRAGRRLLDKAPGPFAGVLPAALEKLDAATLRRLERDLKQLINVLAVDSRTSQTPLGKS